MAKRGPNGIWNEVDLPVTSWESPLHRVVLPTSVLEVAGLPVPVLRWSAVKRQRVLETRPILLDRIERLNELLEDWIVVGREPEETAAWNLVFPHSGHLNMMVFGPDRHGSWNVITVYPLRGKQRGRVDAWWMIRRQEK